MSRLSARLEKMLSMVGPGESLADVGTDHALLPMELYRRGVSTRLILCDLGEGPLEKARDSLRRHGFAPELAPGGVGREREGEFWAGGAFELRQGDGLAPLGEGETDALALAGMGGLLIMGILGANPRKSQSFKKHILQPRNAAPRLRAWLLGNGFTISRDELALEKGRPWEVFLASPRGVPGDPKPGGAGPLDAGGWSLEPGVAEAAEDQGLARAMSALSRAGAALDMSAGLIARKDPLLATWLEREISMADKALAGMARGSQAARGGMEAVRAKRAAYVEVWRHINGD